MRRRDRKPWDGATGGLRDALYRWHRAEHRAPTPDDAPPLSVLPMTSAPVVTPEDELTHGPDAL